MSSETRQKAWNGKVYLCIEVHEPESIGTQEYLLAINRISYLHLHLPTILAYFDRFLDHSKQGSWWFSFADTVLSPVKPIGLLHDMYFSTSYRRPWRIRLNRGEYPANKVMEIKSTEELKSYWSNQLKESCYINNGNSRAVMSLSQENHELLWSSIVNANEPSSCTNFWQIAERFLKPNMKIPIKLYYKLSEDDDWEVKQYSMHWEDMLANLENDELQINKLVTHGVKLRSGLQVSALYTAFAYPDGFLHLIVAV